MMRVLGGLVVVVMLGCIAQVSAGAKLPIVGGSTNGAQEEYDMLHKMGGSHVRLYMLWRYVQPHVTTLEPDLTVSGLRENPARITNWSKSVDWNSCDRQMDMALNASLTPILQVSGGSVYGLPTFTGSGPLNGKLMDPNYIGMPLYLAYQYRAARAAVERYGAHAALYQIENELNEAWLAGFAGQRVSDALGGAWKNWTFLTELLSTLNMAVKDAKPEAKTTMNFHTDVPESVHKLLNLPGYYVDAVANWSHILDIISFDAYPNYVVASPSLGHVVGERLIGMWWCTVHCRLRGTDSQTVCCVICR